MGLPPAAPGPPLCGDARLRGGEQSSLTGGPPPEGVCAPILVGTLRVALSIQSRLEGRGCLSMGERGEDKFSVTIVELSQLLQIAAQHVTRS